MICKLNMHYFEEKSIIDINLIDNFESLINLYIH